MKRFISLVLTLLLLMMSVNTMVFADVTELALVSESITFAPSGNSGASETFDISSLEEGTYSVSVEYVSADEETRKVRGLDFIVDGALELRSYLETQAAAASSNVGSIYVPENAELLEVKNHGIFAITVSDITLTKLNAGDTSENIVFSAQNATSSNGSFTLLTDYYDQGCKAQSATRTEHCGGACPKYRSTTGYHFHFRAANVSDGEFVRHHVDLDWTRYDISDLKPGRYNVTLNMSVVGDGTTLYVDNTSYPVSLTPNSTNIDSDINFADFNAGEIVIGEDSQYLRIENTGNNAYLIKTIEFEEIPPLRVVSFESNADVDDAVVARGADVFEITMNHDIDTTTVTDATVEILDGNDDALSSVVSASGKVITVKLKDSLDFEADYTISIDGVIAENEMELEEPAEVPFSTADDAETAGEATIEVTSYEAEDGVVTASGYVKGSHGLGISGREVQLYTQFGAEEQVFRVSAMSGDSGAFAITCSMPGDAEGGRHNVEITSDYVTSPYGNYVLIFTEEIGIAIKDAFTGLEDTAAVEDALDAWGEYIEVGMDWEDIDLIVAERNDIYAHLVDKEFETPESAINTFVQAVYFEVLTQTEDALDIVDILDDDTKNVNVTGFDASLWNVLEEANKENVATEALSYDSADMADFAESLNADVMAEIKVQFNIVPSEITFEAVDIINGETANVTASIGTEIENVRGIHIEFAYDNASKALFEKDGIEVDVIDGMEYTMTTEDNVISIDITSESVMTVSGDIVTLSIPTTKEDVGTYSAEVSGYIYYHPEEIEGEDGDFFVDFTVAQNPNVAVNGVLSLAFKGKDISEFYDKKGYDLDGITTGYTYICHKTDWAKYNIYPLSEGIYEITVNYAAPSSFSLTVEADGNTMTKTLAGTGDSTTFTTAILGAVTLSGNQDYLKILNGGDSTAYFEVIYVNKIYAPEITEINGNAGISSGIMPRGTDNIALTYNNALESSSLKEKSVVVKAKNGAVIPSRARISANQIIIDLTKTLDYDTEYTISISDAEDIYGQDATSTATFKTAGEGNTLGTSNISIEAFKVNGDVFTVSGTVLSSAGIGIEGRTVKLSALAPSGSVYDVWAEGVSGEDGAFSLSYTFDSDSVSGKYDVKLEYEYGLSAYTGNACYFDADTNEEICDDFFNLATGADVLAKLTEYEELFGLDLETMQAEIDFSYITESMTEREFETAGEIVNEVNERFALEKVNQAESADEVLALIDNTEALMAIGEIQRDRWDALSSEEQTQIATDIYAGDRIEEPSALLETIDGAINAILTERYTLSSATVSVNSADVNVGQNASLTFVASEAQDSVVGITIKFDYTGAEAKLFEDVTSYSLSKDLKDLTVKKTIDDGKVIFNITVAQNNVDTIQKVSFTDEIINIGFKASEGSEGSYYPTVSGCITYHVDEENQSSAYFVDVPFEITQNPTIKVTKIADSNTSNKKDEPIGGGAPGGNNYGTQGSANGSADEIPSTTNEGLPEQLIPKKFSDLETVSWAKESIEALADKGIINGRGDGTFAPNDTVTRAEFCKMIAIAFDAVKADAACEFDDVSSDAWYYTYVASAKNAGFINGKTESDFAPLDTVSREEMVTIALRALGIEASDSSEKFADDDSISDYAKGAVYTLKQLGILNGVGDNMFAPKAEVTRAMAAKVVYALITA